LLHWSVDLFNKYCFWHPAKPMHSEATSMVSLKVASRSSSSLSSVWYWHQNDRTLIGEDRIGTLGLSLNNEKKPHDQPRDLRKELGWLPVWCTRCLLLYLLYLPPKHPKTICHPHAFTPNEPFSTQNCIPNNSYTKQYTKRPWQQKLFHQTTFRSEGFYTRQILHQTFAPNNLSIKQLFPALKQLARRNLEEILEGSDGSQAGALAVKFRSKRFGRKSAKDVWLSLWSQPFVGAHVGHRSQDTGGW